MPYKIDYLLRYVSMDTFNNILNNKNKYILELLNDNYVDVKLNIEYLIRYGVSNIDKNMFNLIDDLIVKHSDFINKIREYEKNLTKEEVITLIENI